MYSLPSFSYFHSVLSLHNFKNLFCFTSFCHFTELIQYLHLLFTFQSLIWNLHFKSLPTIYSLPLLSHWPSPFHPLCLAINHSLLLTIHSVLPTPTLCSLPSLFLTLFHFSSLIFYYWPSLHYTHSSTCHYLFSNAAITISHISFAITYSLLLTKTFQTKLFYSNSFFNINPSYSFSSLHSSLQSNKIFSPSGTVCCHHLLHISCNTTPTPQNCLLVNIFVLTNLYAVYHPKFGLPLALPNSESPPVTFPLSHITLLLPLYNSTSLLSHLPSQTLRHHHPILL